MNRKYPYFPTVPVASGKQAGTEWFVMACRRRWGFKNLGTWVVRDMRGKPGQPSVHSSGAAMDIGYGPTKEDRAKAVQAWNWFLQNSKALGIVAVHDYSFGKFGRGYRCSRGEGSDGVLVYKNRGESAGAGGRWLHVELDPHMATSEDAIKAAWKALPRP